METSTESVELNFKNLTLGGYNLLDKPIPQFPPIIIPFKKFEEFVQRKQKVKKVIFVDGWKITITVILDTKKLPHLSQLLLDTETLSKSLPRTHTVCVPLEPEQIKVEDPENPGNDLLWSARIKGTFDISLP
ncbi:hypothetical protein [Bacillus cereus]|uniref:hypothetical protein n=1 Tax=Bacillus cereus TaxID=1396 RepID=UPI000BF8D748|nr:hypothetical protein [Bacillus cereus]PER10983.1 hypothetical protein CN489_17250 [Bacillus cereus]PFK43112.1 hypothetical protein COJ20_09470 [Bacillus cereus]PFL55048.1 hypothetical protein COJ33_11145 [Bacillus cereus]